MGNYNEVLDKIKNGEIKYPVLRKGETFIEKKIFLHIFKKDNNYELGTGHLFNSLEEAIKYYNSLDLIGDYYIICKEAKNSNNWKINISF